MEDGEFYKKMPKVELHAHLNGSISPGTMKKLLDLHKKLWPEEKMPEDSETMIRKGSLGNIDDPFRMFGLIHTITDHVGAVAMAAHDVIREFAEDGVRYLELRSTPRAVQGRMSASEYCKTIIGEIEKANEELDIQVKLILAIDRRKLKDCEDTVKLFLELRQLHGDVMAGIDLSGDPRVGEAVSILPQLGKARELNVPLAIHLAEISNQDETMAFLKFKPDRIGHGTCIHPGLGGHPDLWSQLVQYPVPVEASRVLQQSVDSHHDQPFFLITPATLDLVTGVVLELPE